MTAELDSLTDTTVEIPADLETLNRKDLLALGTQLQIPSHSNMSNPQLREAIKTTAGVQSTERQAKIVENQKQTAAKISALDTPEINAAKATYEEAKQRVNDCIKTNQTAMVAAKADPTDADLKEAYRLTREAHKASITHIQKVRPEYKEMVKQALAALDK
jgi:hypothetical protein